MKLIFIEYINMRMLISDEEFNKAKSRANIPLECKHCGKTFWTKKHTIQLALRKRQKYEDGDFTKGEKNTGDYCSQTCKGLFGAKFQSVICKNCGKEFVKKFTQIKNSPNHFCSQSCAATYNNKNKSHGYRRSKLEVYLEEQIELHYPELHCSYNGHDTIGSELDFYFPTLKLAIELNGIFHYEPIYGDDKLNKIQNNDQQKFKSCIEKEIELCIIDSSKCKYLTSVIKKEFWEIVRGVIKKVYGRHINSGEET